MADKEIVISEKPSSSGSQLGSTSRSVCLVCQKQFSQYTCPRCNIRCCSLHCYKSHSLQCTESFMRENVVEELRQVRPDDESKRKMMDILKRFQFDVEQQEEDDNMDEDEPGLSEETIQKVLSGGHTSYDDLSPKEKKLFRRAIASGELSKMIQPWDPWWSKPSALMISLGQDGTELIQSMVNPGETSSPQDDMNSEHPPGPETPLQPVGQLIFTDPSPLLAFHLVDIIYSYCFTLRLYNGDWQSDPTGAAAVVLSSSYVLGQRSQPESLLEAISNCLEATCSLEFKHMGGLQFGFALVDDVASLISLGGGALVCALSDLRCIIQAGGKPKKRAGIKSKLKLAERKVYFMMCWVNEQAGDVWSSLAALVQAERASALEFQSSRRSPSKPMENEKKKKSKALIEEVL